MSSITAYKKFGINTNTIRFLSTESFSVPELYLDCFDTYYILKWSKEWFLEQSAYGQIKRNGKYYNIVYHRITRGDIIAAPYKSQLMLSFRQAAPEFGLSAYALVTAASK